MSDKNDTLKIEEKSHNLGQFKLKDTYGRQAVKITFDNLKGIPNCVYVQKVPNENNKIEIIVEMK